MCVLSLPNNHVPAMARVPEPWQQMGIWGNETRRSSVSAGPGPPRLGEDKCGPDAPEAGLFQQGDRAEPPGPGWDIDPWGQSFVFPPISFATKPQVFLCVGFPNTFLMTPWKNPSSTGNISAFLEIIPRWMWLERNT